MRAPQIIMLALFGIGLLLYAHYHGKPRGPVNFWNELFSVVVELAILYWGGFFK